MLPKYYIELDLNIKSKEELLTYGSKIAKHLELINNETTFLNELIKREEEITTAIGKGVAFPHGRTCEVKENFVLIFRLTNPIDFNALDGKPVSLLFLIGTKDSDNKHHLQILQRIAKGLLQSDIKQVFLTRDELAITNTFKKLFLLNIGIICNNEAYYEQICTQYPNFNFYLINDYNYDLQAITDYTFVINSTVEVKNVQQQLDNLSKV